MKKYLPKLKENISQDIPFITSVNPFDLPSIQNQYNLPELFWNAIPGGHAIVIVGFNETNQTVCYNDPAAGYFGGDSFGTYAWMTYETLKKAISRTHGDTFSIWRFVKINEPSR